MTTNKRPWTRHKIKDSALKSKRIEKLEGELKIKSEFLSSRQCPDHSGKWQRGDCLQCRIEQLETAFERLLTQLANNTKVAAQMFDEIVEAQQVLGSARDTAPEDDWRLYECAACGWQVEATPTGLEKRGSMTCSQCGYGNLHETVGD